MTKRNLILAVAAISALFFTACIQKDFDQPPAGGSDPAVDPGLIRTIQDIKALYTGGDAVEITDSVFIAGIVTADDRSGNFYQTIVMEDETAGVSIRVGITDFFNIYPIGRRVYVMLKGLYVGQYADLVQIGVRDIEEPDGVERIPNFQVEEHLLPGMFGLDVTPEEVTINQLAANRDEYQNRLVKLSSVEFSCSEAGEPYADAVNQQTINRLVYDCDGNNIILRNSGFAEFASDLLPEGNGTLTAIFSIFADDDQLFIRETSDLDMNGPRCVNEVVTGLLEDFESAENFEPIAVNNWQSISVIGTEPWEGRSFSGNRYTQVQGFGSDSEMIETWLVSPKVDLSQAMTLSFESKIGFWTHDGLQVFLSTNFDGCNIGGASWVELGDAVIANPANSPDGVGGYANFFIYSGEIDISNYSGEGVIGFRYVGDNSANTTTYQIDNVMIGEEPPVICDVNSSINEDFESLTTGSGVNFELDCWQNVALSGNELWEARSFSSNSYAQISGFNSPSSDIETFLITPPFDLAQVSTLRFDTKAGFCVHEGFTVHISTDYDGMDVGAATWTELSAVVSNSGNSNCNGGYADDFISSGDVDLSAFSGTGYVAFRYVGNNSDETTTIQVDNVTLQ